MRNTTEGDLSELGLPLMYQKRLNRNGITTIKELCEKSERDLYYLRNVGHKCIEAVKEALAARGLSMRSGGYPTPAPTVAPAPTCICLEQPEMELIADVRRGQWFECPKCGRLLYKSRVTPVQTWYRAEVTFNDTLVEACERHCNACGSLEPHVKVGENLWQCLRCVAEGRVDFSQKSPTGS